MWPGESWQANETHLTKHLTSLPVAQAKLMMSLWKKGPCYGSRKSSRLRGLVGWSTSSSGYISLSVMSLFWETTDKVLPALCSVLSEVPFWVPCSGSQCLNSSPSVFQLLFPPMCCSLKQLVFLPSSVLIWPRCLCSTPVLRGVGRGCENDGLRAPHSYCQVNTVMPHAWTCTMCL